MKTVTITFVVEDSDEGYVLNEILQYESWIRDCVISDEQVAFEEMIKERAELEFEAEEINDPDDPEYGGDDNDEAEILCM